MKRNTILISVLGVAGLVAVWWFMLRRASAADPLADTLTGTETSGTATLGSSQLAGGSGTDLLSTLTGLVTALTGKPASGTTTAPASSTTPPLTWIKNAGTTDNRWTNRFTGQTVVLDKRHSPNNPASLTQADYGLIAASTPASQHSTVVYNPPPSLKTGPRPGTYLAWTMPLEKTPGPAPASSSTNTARSTRVK